MKKIVFVLEQLYGGGAERVTNALANEICKNSEYEVHILTYWEDASNEYPSDARVVRHNMGLCSENKHRLQLIKEKIQFLRSSILTIRPDCVLSLAEPKTSFLLFCAMEGSNIPLILSERNDPVRFPSSKFVRMLRQVSYNRCSGVVFQTMEARSFFSANIQKKSVVISNPVTPNLPEPYTGIREKRIVNFCRLHAQKNLDLLIDAFSKAGEIFPEHTLWIYGDGPERERLTQKVKAMGLSGKVFLPGYSNQIYDDIRKAAIFISSSDYEGISNSMLEAIAIGIPTICTDCPAGGARETIRNGVSGLLVPIGNVEAMSDAIKLVLSDSEYASSLSKNGSQLRNEISVKTIAQKWIDFIEKQLTKSY